MDVHKEIEKFHQEMPKLLERLQFLIDHPDAKPEIMMSVLFDQVDYLLKSQTILMQVIKDINDRVNDLSAKVWVNDK